MIKNKKISLNDGIEVIKSELITIPNKPGIYQMIGENEELTPGATISDEFVLKNPDGSYDYEIIDVGMGKGRNILKFDLDKIKLITGLIFLNMSPLHDEKFGKMLWFKAIELLSEHYK